MCGKLCCAAYSSHCVDNDGRRNEGTVWSGYIATDEATLNEKYIKHINKQKAAFYRSREIIIHMVF